MTFVVPSNHGSKILYPIPHYFFPSTHSCPSLLSHQGPLTKTNSYSLIAKGTYQPFEVRAISHFTEVKTEAQNA